MRYSCRFKICSIAIIAFSALSLPSLNAASDMEHTVDELPYGLALYDFFQDKHFSAITDILVARKNQTLVDRNKTAELLLGGLYLSYGLRDKADDIFTTIALNETRDVPRHILDQALFQIGKNYFQGGFEEKSKQLLTSIGNSRRSTLSPVYESERLNILSDIYMHDHRYSDVLQLLDMFPEKSIWKEYTKFNLGVSLVKDNRINDGLMLLKSLAESEPSTKELDILHDQANLALAATYAKLDEPDLSVKYFEKIKLSNLQSNSALLGLGWVKFKTASYEDALSAWFELSKSPKSDPDVQEALVLIPYALERHGEKAKALRQYDLAIASYSQRLKNAEATRKYIEQGGITRILESIAASERIPQPDDIIQMMAPVMSDYLLGFITSNGFRHAAINYHELAVLAMSLSQWDQAIPSLKLILDEKTNAYNDRLAAVINSPKFEYAKNLQERRAVLADEFNRSLSINATRTLANRQERKLFSTLDRIKTGLDSIGDEDPELIELKDKYRFLSGLLKWNIDTDYAPRLWAVRENLNDLDQALQGMNRAIGSLSSVWNRAPAEHAIFREMIRGKEERIDTLRQEVKREMTALEAETRIMAQNAIEQERAQIKNYNDRAVFGKARVYDSMVLKN
jgi:tetratricopeptide (TPR) repeat protein